MKAQNLIKLSVVASVSLMISQFALAQGVGNLGSLPTQFPQTGTPPGWIVTSTAGPIPVVLDPLGPAWGKSFTDPNGGNFFYPPTSPPNNPPLNVQEFLVVAPNSPPWTDWHEDVIGINASGAPDLGWSWANPTMRVNGLPAPGLTTSLSGNNVSFFFNPIFPGDQVIIRKQLVYSGPAGAAFNGTLAIHEYPTPEPATLGLLGLGGAAMLRRRSRTTVG